MVGRRKARPSSRRTDAAWAVKEVGHAELGDERRSRRLVRVVSALANRPAASLPEACETWADTKAAYRFFSNDHVEASAITEAHAIATVKRAHTEDMILAVQDTTVFNFTRHKSAQGMGQIRWPLEGKAKSLGFYTHSCMAVSTKGLPLGLLHQNSWIRSEKTLGRSEREREQTPIAEKESQRWLTGITESARLVGSGTRIVAVADREADIFDFFTCAIEHGQDFLVRSSSTRATEDGYSWDEVEKAPVAQRVKVEIPRSGERKARTATLEIRFATVQLKPPRHRRGRSISTNIILAREAKPPKGEAAVCWRLMTSLPVTTGEEANQCVQWYALRWRIERFHYTLKSGCRIEELQLESRDRIERALAAFSIVAWFLTALTYAAREAPRAPSSTYLQPHEWKALTRLANPKSPTPRRAPTLSETVRLIAQLGGFLNRKGDGEPGVKVIWRGYRRLQDISMILEQLEAADRLVGKG